MKHVFKAGKRFDKMRNVCAFANIAVVFCFYFVYRFLLEPYYPGFVGAPLMILFILIGAAAVKLTVFVGDKLKNTIRYEIGKECLIVSKGKTERRYPWANFTEVRYERFRIRDLMPVYFMVAGEKLVLNQYVDEIYELTHQIIKHLDPKVPVDNEIRNRINVMR